MQINHMLRGEAAVVVQVARYRMKQDQARLFMNAINTVEKLSFQIEGNDALVI